MSSSAQPITPAVFASALPSLPAENLYAKASELRNSIAHLERSNAQLQLYSDSIAHDSSIPDSVRGERSADGEGDRECVDAIRENDVVIQRQRERIGLLKAEVERRGGMWHDADGGVGLEGVRRNGAGDGAGDGEDDRMEVEGEDDDDATPDLTRASTINTQNSSGGSAGAGRQGGRLTDEELRRQLAERMREDEEEDGMHL